MKLQKISAILGPTNTGKTFSAINKLLNYSNGVMGFPLRLLARENYERVKQEIGSNKVALVTGEEKIVPKSAKYFLYCRINSITISICWKDEIQLCADYEREHLFSGKIIKQKRIKGNNILGSLSMEKILKKYIQIYR